MRIALIPATCPVSLISLYSAVREVPLILRNSSRLMTAGGRGVTFGSFTCRAITSSIISLCILTVNTT